MENQSFLMFSGGSKWNFGKKKVNFPFSNLCEKERNHFRDTYNIAYKSPELFLYQ